MPMHERDRWQSRTKSNSRRRREAQGKKRHSDAAFVSRPRFFSADLIAVGESESSGDGRGGGSKKKEKHQELFVRNETNDDVETTVATLLINGQNYECRRNVLLIAREIDITLRVSLSFHLNKYRNFQKLHKKFQLVRLPRPT